MSKKDFEKYFDQVATQYVEMLAEVRDMEEEVLNNMISPEQLDNMKAMVAPLKENYLRLSYVRYLLNRPVKKKKHAVYANQNKNVIKATKGHTAEDVLAENNKILENLTL